ncbi:uncharacterized protein Fot_24075 [Forsythia ovata]|uniref:Gag-pol polyprotein n=1 Tax=Forsythia ovata TaxID=205694 RepID=A0ABD1U561_9LAMI
MVEINKSRSNGNSQDAVVEHLATLIETQSQQILQHVQPYKAPRIDENAGERFRNLNPPVFEGTNDLMKPEEWLRTIDNIFKYNRVPDIEKVNYASFMLRGSAWF